MYSELLFLFLYKNKLRNKIAIVIYCASINHITNRTKRVWPWKTNGSITFNTLVLCYLRVQHISCTVCTKCVFYNFVRLITNKLIYVFLSNLILTIFTDIINDIDNHCWLCDLIYSDKLDKSVRPLKTNNFGQHTIFFTYRVGNDQWYINNWKKWQ